jgi:hypothetical protein
MTTTLTWVVLNDLLREANLAKCHKLIQQEMAGAARPRFLLRIHSRINRLRAQDDQKEVARLKKEVKKTHKPRKRPPVVMEPVKPKRRKSADASP